MKDLVSHHDCFQPICLSIFTASKRASSTTLTRSRHCCRPLQIDPHPHPLRNVQVQWRLCPVPSPQLPLEQTDLLTNLHPHFQIPQARQFRLIRRLGLVSRVAVTMVGSEYTTISCLLRCNLRHPQICSLIEVGLSRQET